jgi:hypothetical protein
MAIPALHIRPARNRLSWHGSPAETWTVLQRETHTLLTRWRPAALVLTRAQFDDEGLPGEPRRFDRLEIQDERTALETLVDVSEIVAEDPIDARVALPVDHGDATTLCSSTPTSGSARLSSSKRRTSARGGRAGSPPIAR